MSSQSEPSHCTGEHYAPLEECDECGELGTCLKDEDRNICCSCAWVNDLVSAVCGDSQ